MKNIVFSFLSFLSGQIGSTNLTRQLTTSTNPDSNLIKVDSTNITVLNVTFDKHSTEVFFAIDIVYQNENECYDKVNALDVALRTGAFYAPLKDYTIPTAPTDTGKLLTFSSPKFRRVTDDNCRFNTLLSVKSYERY
jgi:hypothetical protein